jgi:hypothetical protein
MPAGYETAGILDSAYTEATRRQPPTAIAVGTRYVVLSGQSTPCDQADGHLSTPPAPGRAEVEAGMGREAEALAPTARRPNAHCLAHLPSLPHLVMRTTSHRSTSPPSKTLAAMNSQYRPLRRFPLLSKWS